MQITNKISELIEQLNKVKEVFEESENKKDYYLLREYDFFKKLIEEEKVQQINKIPEKKEKIEIKIEQPVNNKCDNKMKQLSTEEYFRLTVQDALEQGLLNMALVHPTNPIKFLGNFLIEKSKHNSAL